MKTLKLLLLLIVWAAGPAYSASTVTDRIDGVSTSLAIKAPVKAATTANITLSGAQTIDGVAVTTGDRVLVKNQTTTTANGIYQVDSGTWTRALDFDGNRDVATGTVVFVTGGTTNANTAWRVTTANPVTIGSSSIVWSAALFGDSSSVTFLQAGTGAVARSVQAKGRDIVNVMDFGAVCDGTTDDTAAIQAAHDSLASTGGILWFPDGKFCSLNTNGTYVNITKPNVVLYGPNAWVISPNSDNIESVTVATRYLNGFRITGNNATVSVNMRGPAVAWTSGSNRDNLNVRNMKFSNMYATAISINTTAFGVLDVNGVVFEYGRDLLVNIIGGISNGSPTVTYASASTTNNFVGQVISGTGIPAGTTVSAITPGVSLTLSANATATNGSATLSVSDPSNYEAITRSAASTDGVGTLIRVIDSTFFSVAGGIDAQNVSDLIVGGGTAFYGCDYTCIKLATSNSGFVAQNLTVDETVTFYGACANTSSVNRHLNCKGGRTTDGYSAYVGFMQVFDKVSMHGSISNCGNGNYGFQFLDGSLSSATLNFNGMRATSCQTAIADAQGSISMVGARLKSSNFTYTSSSPSRIRTARIANNWFEDSVVVLTKNSFGITNPFIEVVGNYSSYSVDNLGWLRFQDFGTDSGTAMWVDGNTSVISGGGNTVAMNLATSGTKGFLGTNNNHTGFTVTGGNFVSTYEPGTTGTVALTMPFRDCRINIVNTNAAANVTYTIHDSAMTNAPIGTCFTFMQTHATRTIAFVATLGAINGGTTVTTGAQYSGGTLKKIAANTWILIQSFGTVVVSAIDSDTQFAANDDLYREAA